MTGKNRMTRSFAGLSACPWLSIISAGGQIIKCLACGILARPAGCRLPTLIILLFFGPHRIRHMGSEHTRLACSRLSLAARPPRQKGVVCRPERLRAGPPRGSWGRLFPALLAVAMIPVALGAAARASEAADRSPLEQAAALRAAGRYDEALDVLRIESREVKQAEGDEAPQLLAINDLAAEILIDMGRLDNARNLLEKTITAREQAAAGGPDEAVGIARSLLSLARLQMVEKRFPEAIKAAKRSLSVADKATGPASDSVARARASLERIADSLDKLLGPADPASLAARRELLTSFISLGMTDAAIATQKQIVTGLKARDGSDPTAVLRAASDLADLLVTAGFAERATATLDDVLSSSSVPASPEGIEALRSLATAQLAANQLILAEATLDSVLEATGAAEGPPTIRSSADRCRRLLVDVRRNSLDELPGWWEPMLAALRKTPPSESAAGVAGLLAAGDVAAARADRATDLELASRALRIAQGARSPSAPDIAAAACHLAAAQLAISDQAAARKTAASALAAAEKALGPGDAHTTTLRMLLASATAAEGDGSQATTLAQTALARGLPRPSTDWERMAVGIYDDLATETGTPTLREAFIAARGRQFGEQHPHVGMAWALFGGERLAAADWPAAREYLTRAVAIQRLTVGKNDPETAASMALLAHAERAAGDLAAAEQTASSAVAAWEEAAGADHPGTLAALDVLVTTLLQAGKSNQSRELLERLCRAESFADPVRRAGHLVQLAGLIATQDRAAAEARLETALSLPCWNRSKPDAADRLRLAYTAARAAHVYATLGDRAASESALRRARSLALQAANPASTLAAVDRLATTGEASRP